MASGLADQLQEIPLERENQDLKEIIEIAFQITAQLEIENIIKNVVWSFVSKFQTDTVTVSFWNLDTKLQTTFLMMFSMSSCAVIWKATSMISRRSWFSLSRGTS